MISPMLLTRMTLRRDSEAEVSRPSMTTSGDRSGYRDLDFNFFVHQLTGMFHGCDRMVLGSPDRDYRL